MLITVFTIVRFCYLRFMLMLFTHLRLRLPIGIFPSVSIRNCEWLFHLNYWCNISHPYISWLNSPNNIMQRFCLVDPIIMKFSLVFVASSCLITRSFFLTNSSHMPSAFVLSSVKDGPETGYPDWRLSWPSSVPPSKCWDSTSELG
jgi:hypothetical protein